MDDILALIDKCNATAYNKPLPWKVAHEAGAMLFKLLEEIKAITAEWLELAEVAKKAAVQLETCVPHEQHTEIVCTYMSELKASRTENVLLRKQQNTMLTDEQVWGDKVALIHTLADMMSNVPVENQVQWLHDQAEQLYKGANDGSHH